MKHYSKTLSSLLALLLSLAMLCSLTCFAAYAEASDRSDPEPAQTLRVQSEDWDDDEEDWDEDDEDDYGDDDEDDNGDTSDDGQRDTAPYTLNVKSGDDLEEALEEALSRHSHVIIPAGTYTCEYISLSGLGDTVLEAEGATITGAYLGFGDSGKAVVKGGVWKDAYVGVRGASNVELRPEKLSIQGSEGSHGLLITGAENLTLANITIEGAGDDGIFISSSKNITLINPTVKKSYFFGIALRNGSTATIEGGLITTSGQRPRSAVSREDAKAGGLSVTEGSECTVYDATFSQNVACGVAVAGDSKSETSTVNLYGVKLLDNGDHGVGGNPYAVVNLDKSKKQRSLAEGNAHNGVQVIDTSFSDFIRNTDFRKNGQDGLSIAKGSKVKLVENCTMNNNKKHGVMIRHDSVVQKLNKCTMTGNKGYGILLNCEKGTAKTSAVITNSKLNKNDRDGIRLTGKKTSGSVKKCTLNGNKWSGLIVYDKSTLNEVSKTKATGNSRYGLGVYGKCTVKKASGNTFSGNKKRQVHVASGGKSAEKATKK